MKSNNGSLFYDDENSTVTKKKDILKSQGYTEIVPGFWADQIELDNIDDPISVCVGFEHAYKIAKKQHVIDSKCTPPEPVWLSPDYLPGLKEAQQFNVDLFTKSELIEASLDYIQTGSQHVLIFDVECYSNYFLVAFKSLSNGKTVYFELSDYCELDIQKLTWVFEKFCVVGFNSKNYDLTICALALKGLQTHILKSASDAIIVDDIQPYRLLKQYNTKTVKCNHVDLMNVAPLMASLKIYAGRLHCPKMQDLPFPHDAILSHEQIDIIRFYCINDLDNTILLCNNLKSELSLRATLSNDYSIDLRSKSDAQIAESVLGKSIEKLNGFRSYPPKVIANQSFDYTVPDFISFQTPLLNNVLTTIRNCRFRLNSNAQLVIPPEVKQLDINIGAAKYTIGIGGLHSTEKSAAYIANDDYAITENDVTSFYPAIILNLGLFPEQLTNNFLIAYRDIVERRIVAKKSGNKKEADLLKITVNGAFGKLGNAYSILNSPDLLIRVTLTGQLSLLMLIEQLELANITVISSNTDAVVSRCHKTRLEIMDNIIQHWQKITGYNLESTSYIGLYSRDVNNYLALKNDKKFKLKGVFLKPGLRKNPQNLICVEAIKNHLTKTETIENTILNCKDITKFLTVRTVNGGAVKLYSDKESLYLGKAIRWYYGDKHNGDTIVYAKTGKKVPRSENAIPVMQLPDCIPGDLDYQWYINETYAMLSDIGL